MKQLIYIILSVLVFACSDTKSDTIQLISKAEMDEILSVNDVQLVDVRTISEYKTGSIPNAANVDFFSENFENDILALDKTQPVIVFCKKGGRSAKCAKKMKALGFTKIYDLEGGYSKWKASE